VASNLKASPKQIRELALSRKLVLSYTPEVARELSRLGGNFIQLLNLLRRATVEEIGNELRYEGQLENGTEIVVVGAPFQELCEKFKEVRTGLFVRELSGVSDKQSPPKRSA
jgi:hypothetical protein